MMSVSEGSSTVSDEQDKGLDMILTFWPFRPLSPFLNFRDEGFVVWSMVGWPLG